MTDTQPQIPAGTAADGQNPTMRILGQYIKDLSFENPGAPASLTSGSAQPAIQVSVDVGGRRLTDNEYETELKITVNAKRDDVTTFLVELAYAGIVQTQNVTNEMLQPLLLMEVPRLLFPFARRVVADVTRDGGFPPLMLEPIDFTQLYRQQMAKQQEAAGASENGGGAEVPPTN